MIFTISFYWTFLYYSTEYSKYTVEYLGYSTDIDVFSVIKFDYDLYLLFYFYFILLHFIYLFILFYLFIFCKNYRFPVFHGFTHFSICEWDFIICGKIFVCLCMYDKKFVASVTRKLMHSISQNFIFNWSWV